MEAGVCFNDSDCEEFFSGLGSDPNMDPHTVFQAADTPPLATALWGCMQNTMDMGSEYESEESTSTCDRPCEDVHPDLADGFDLVLPLSTMDRANCFPMAENLTEGVFAWDGLSYKDSAAGKGRALRLGAYVGSTHPMLLVCHRLQFAEPG